MCPGESGTAAGSRTGTAAGSRMRPAGRTRHTDIHRPASKTRPASKAGLPEQCGGLPLCGALGVVNDAKSSAMRESSKAPG